MSFLFMHHSSCWVTEEWIENIPAGKALLFRAIAVTRYDRHYKMLNRKHNKGIK